MAQVSRVRARTKVALPFMVFAFIGVGLVSGWSNGGYSTDPAHPVYGTHDWIAQHALDWLPTAEKQYIQNNLAAYLYGTELPDNANAPGGDGIGDTTKHHIYYSDTGTVTDDSSAQRASVEYNIALNYLKEQDWADAAETVGTMTHYIADMGVFGHVMGASTPWGAEVHHSDYETYVDDRTKSYIGTGSGISFNQFLSFDGSLSILSAYNAALNVAYDTTFGGNNHLNCTWMDTNYNWNNSTFSDRCGQSLNLAVNAVTDVLHTLYQAAGVNSPTPTASPTASPTSPSPTASPIATLAGSTPPTNTITTTPTTLNPENTSNLTPTPPTPEFPLMIIIALVIAATTCTALLKFKGSMQNRA